MALPTRLTNSYRSGMVQNQGLGAPALRRILPYCYTQDGGALPVVYGTCKIEGTVLYQGLGQQLSGQNKKGLIVWVGLCAGQIILKAIYKDANIRLVGNEQGGSDYLNRYFNDGTQAFKPSDDSYFTDQAGQLIANVSALPGIAHILFDGNDGSGKCQIITNNDNRLPDLRYVVKRNGLLSTPGLNSTNIDVFGSQSYVPPGTSTMINYHGWWTLHYPDTHPYNARWFYSISNGFIYCVNRYPNAVDSPTDGPSDNGSWRYMGTLWRAGSSYKAATGDIGADKYVIGDDNVVYECIVDHDDADFSTCPPYGLYSKNFWQVAMYRGPNGNDMSLLAGCVCMNPNNEQPYRCIKLTSYDNPAEGLPGTYTGWENDWSPYVNIDPSGSINDFSKVSFGQNPVAIALDLMTNPFYGLGMDSSKFNMDVCNATAAYYNSKGYGLNMEIKDIGEARAFLTKLIDLADMIITVGNDGKIQIRCVIPDASTWLDNLSGRQIMTMVDADFSDFELTRQTWRDVFTEIEATYSEPGRLYEPTSIVGKNEAAMQITGTIKKKSIDLTAFTDRGIAMNRLNEILTRESYPRMTITCEVDRRFYSLRPGDLVSITKEEYGIYNTVFLVTKTTLGRIDSNGVQLELIEPTVTQTYIPDAE